LSSLFHTAPCFVAPFVMPVHNAGMRQPTGNQPPHAATSCTARRPSHSLPATCSEEMSVARLVWFSMQSNIPPQRYRIIFISAREQSENMAKCDIIFYSHRGKADSSGQGYCPETAKKRLASGGDAGIRFRHNGRIPLPDNIRPNGYRQMPAHSRHNGRKKGA